MKEAYENLAMAIVEQAARDYKRSLKKLVKEPHNIEAKKLVADAERFFTGQWIKELTDVDGLDIMNRIKEDLCKKSK
ncbi:hypothetical protein DWW31_18200 [Clostridium sp. AF15-17LB]|nr:hypothetical protein DWW31_18200 [Clostridium sp. AF15-17LB]